MPETLTPSRPIRRLLVLGLAAVAIALAMLELVAVFPSFFVEDDAWFYLQIGHNLGTQRGATLDGIHTTSGFHLAWGGLLGVLAAGVSAVTSSKAVFLVVAMTVYLFLALATADYFGRSVTEKLVLLFFMVNVKMLMEAQLLATVLLVVAHGFLAGRSSRWFYVAVALVPLIRIDAVLMLAPLALVYLARKDFGSLARFGAALAVGIVVHFGVMLLAFGHLASTSSLIKLYRASEMGLGEIVATNLAGYTRYTLGVFVTLAALSLIGAWTSRRSENGIRPLLLIAGPVVFIALHVTANPLLRQWYFLPGLLLMAWLLMRSKPQGLRTVPVVLVCVLAAREVRAAWLFFADNAATGRVAKVEAFLAEVRRLVPEGEPIYQVDGAGFPGFFADRPIVNGDGLVNSYDYVDRLRTDRLAGYLQENDIRYVMTNSPVTGEYLIDNHGLVVARADAEKIAEAGLDRPFEALALWQLPD